MKAALKDTIVSILDDNRVVTVATVRPDGWPQATLVAFVNDGLAIYVFADRKGQKVANLIADPRASLALGKDTRRPLDIKGLSLAAKAVLIEDKGEIAHARALHLDRHPEQKVLPAPNMAEVALVRFMPEVISVIDYSKGFGHSDLVRVTDRDLSDFIESRRHHWAGA